MAIRGSSKHYLIDKIQRRHWLTQAQQVGLSAAMAERLINEVVDARDEVIAQIGSLLPNEFPLDIAKSIFQGIRKQLIRLLP